MRKLFRSAAIVVTTLIVAIVSLAIIGFIRGPRTAAASPATKSVAVPAPSSPSIKTPLLAPVPSPAQSAPAGLDLAACVEVHKLNTLEAQGKETDAALAVFEDAPSLTTAERTEVAAWLEDRIKPGRIPALYWLARLSFLNDDLPEAAKWYAAAGLCGRIDAARLADKSAAGAIPGVETHFSDLKKALAADITLRRNSMAWALEFEDSTNDRAPAAWIAAHGLAFDGTPKTIADDQWQAARQTQRDNWKKLAAE